MTHSIQKTTDKVLFLNELQKITSIDTLILDNLIKTNLINNIFQETNAVSINENVFSFDFSPLKKNYKSLLEFQFFDFHFKNQDYKIVTEQELTHYYYAYLFNENDNTIIALFLDQRINTFVCHLLFKLDIDYSHNYTSDILINEESSILTSLFLEDLSYHNDIHSRKFKSSSIPFICFNNDISNFNFQLIPYIDSYRNHYKSIIRPLKIKNETILNKVYEEAIIRHELKTF